MSAVLPPARKLEGCIFKDNTLRIAGTGLTHKENRGIKILERKICQEAGKKKKKSYFGRVILIECQGSPGPSDFCFPVFRFGEKCFTQNTPEKKTQKQLYDQSL